jgi:hypothetical protein
MKYSPCLLGEHVVRGFRSNGVRNGGRLSPSFFEKSVINQVFAHSLITCHLSPLSLCLIGFIFPNPMPRSYSIHQCTPFSRNQLETLVTSYHSLVDDPQPSKFPEIFFTLVIMYLVKPSYFFSHINSE